MFWPPPQEVARDSVDEISRPGAGKTWKGEDQFWDQAKKNDFEVSLASGSAIGSRWTRVMKAGIGKDPDPEAQKIAQEYLSIKGPHITGKRAAFRKNWAMGEYKTYEVNGHSQSEKHPSHLFLSTGCQAQRLRVSIGAIQVRGLRFAHM